MGGLNTDFSKAVAVHTASVDWQPKRREANMDGTSKGKNQRTRRITKRTVDALKPGTITWDADVKGFGVRCRASGGKFYMVKFRAGGRQR